MIREGLEVLTGGILEKILHDEGYMYRSSKLDPELEIIGRYQSK